MIRMLGKTGLGFGAVFLALSFGAPGAWAARFANQFIEFELPPGWQCSLEGAEWVCQSSEESKKKDAIIVLAAKLKGDQDSIDQYLAYLSAAKSYTSVQGKPVKSEKKSAKTTSLNGQVWVDALHLESEIPGFYTRYLATVKADIGVLVTYSINKDKYQRYLGDFEAMVKTLKVFRKQGGLNTAAGANGAPPNITVPTNMTDNTVFPGAAGGASDRPKPKKDDTMLYIGLGAAVVLFLLWRRRRSQDD